MPRTLPRYHEAYYGYERGSGNPYKVSILFTSRNLQANVRSVLRFLVQEGIDIVHFHGRGWITLSLSVRTCRCKVIRHFHGTDLRARLPGKVRFFYALLGENKVIVSTPDLLSYLWTRAKTHSEWFPNPVDPMFYQMSDRYEEKNVVFLPTRHDENTKKTSVAFEAWKLLRKLNPHVKLKTIMFGKDYPMLYEKFKSDKRIIWLPLMNKRDYMKQLKSSPVIWGQFKLRIISLTELEAMAMGKPVITYFKQYPSELPPTSTYSSPKHIARATNEYLKNEDARKELGASLRRWCLHHHGLEPISHRLHSIYQEIL